MFFSLSSYSGTKRYRIQVNKNTFSVVDTKIHLYYANYVFIRPYAQAPELLFSTNNIYIMNMSAVCFQRKYVFPCALRKYESNWRPSMELGDCDLKWNIFVNSEPLYTWSRSGFCGCKCVCVRVRVWETRVYIYIFLWKIIAHSSYSFWFRENWIKWFWKMGRLYVRQIRFPYHFD